MTLEILKERFSVCRLDSVRQVDLEKPFTFLSVTDEEVSLVCPEEYVPRQYIKRENGWRALRVQGVLDFSLTGILAGLCGVLAENGIAVFAVSTFNTDYLLCREDAFPQAVLAGKNAGYTIL